MSHIGWKIIICLLTPVLGAQLAHGEIWNIQCSLDVDQVDTTVIFLNSPTKLALTEDMNHAYHTLNRSVFCWVEGEKLLSIAACEFGCMFVDSSEEGV